MTAAFAVSVTAVLCCTHCTAPPGQPVAPAAVTSPSAMPTDSGAPAPDPASVETVTAADLGASWHPGCPVSPGQLRRISLDHLGVDGRRHRGQLIVQEKLVPQVIAIFEQLYWLGYPIQRMRTAEKYRDADDELSMEDNNTSAFNCRTIPGSGHWAKHAYGRAVDLNPVLNPYVDASGDCQPKNARGYLDRGRTDPGLIHDRDSTVRTFTDRGWRWGGHWRSPIDYQHFETP